MTVLRWFGEQSASVREQLFVGFLIVVGGLIGIWITTTIFIFKLAGAL